MKLNTKSACISVVLMVCFMLCQGQGTNWVRQIKGSRESFAHKVLADDAGFVYVTGTYTDSASFSPDIKFYIEKNTSFLAKYDPEGNIVWVKSLAGQGRNYGSSIAIDKAGFVYLYGGFETAASLGPFHLTAELNRDQLYLIKLNQNGTPIWAKQTIGKNKTYPSGIVINNANQIYLTGTVFDTTFFIDTAVAPATWNSPFIARLDTEGGLKWIKVLNGQAGLKDINSVTTNSSGDIFFCGQFTNNLLLDSIELAVSSYYDTIIMYTDTFIQEVFNRDYFIGQIDSTDKIGWAVQSASPTDEYAYSIVADNSDNLYITGGTEDSIGRSVFIARHNQHDGGTGWFKIPVECGEGRSVAVDESNNIYITGVFCGSAEFGGYQATSNGGGDIFIMNFDSSGNFNWITGHGSTNSDYGFSICESNGSIFLAGVFIAEAIFGNITVTTTNSVNFDAFVAKLDRSFLLSSEEPGPEQKMLVYPNPFGDQITVTTSFLTNEFQIARIFDITGREVLNKVIDSTSDDFTINTSHLRSGLYLLALYGDENNLVEKIIKQ